MKYLVAFALIAAAAALPEPVRLLAPAPAEVVPQAGMDEIAMTVKVVDAPEVAEAMDFAEVAADIAAPADFSAYAVNVVDEAVNAEPLDASNVPFRFNVDQVNAEAPAENADTAFAVNFVDEAVIAEALNAIEDVVYSAVHVVDHIDAEVPAEMADSVFAVNVFDEPVNADAPVAVKIMESPLPGSVILPLDAVVAPSVDAVKVVDTPDVDEETPVFMPIKQYPDSRWR